MKDLPTFEDVEYHRARMWQEREQVTAQAGIVYRVCAMCGADFCGVSDRWADEKLAAHVEAEHGLVE